MFKYIEKVIINHAYKFHEIEQYFESTTYYFVKYCKIRCPSQVSPLTKLFVYSLYSLFTLLYSFFIFQPTANH